MERADAQSLIERLTSAPASAAELGQALSTSRATVSRLIRPLERAGRIVRSGTTRGARYGLAREVGAAGSSWPLYRIDAAGQPERIATVHAIERNRYFVVDGPERIRGSFEGLPYYLQDARPSGFLGRAIPAAHPELGLPPRVADWTDDHVLLYLTQRGTESVGDLMLGGTALDRYLGSPPGPLRIAEADRAQVFVERAAAAMRGAPPGSSAHGEHPKFAARIVQASGEVEHVLVKFSPPRSTPVGARWADLLIAEHLASIVLAEHGIPAARTQLLEYGEQVFLQSARFDRTGDSGRRGVCSLLAVDTAWYGRLDRWQAAAERLRTDGLLSDEDAERLSVLDAFGALIANTDRHFGNVTLLDDYEGAFRLAPNYDMLPMLFAPQDGHLVEREFTPQGPTAATLAIWPTARAMAEDYWRRVSSDPRITREFGACSARALQSIRDLPERAAPRTGCQPES